MVMWKFHQIQISVLITFYWNRAMLTHLSIVYGHLPATRAEVNSCDRCHRPMKPKIFAYSLVLYKNSLQTPVLLCI